MPRYTGRMSLGNWQEHLQEKRIQLLPTRSFSIVYKHFSQRRGNCMYVGRTDSPLTRPGEYLNNPRNVLPRTGRAHNFVSYKVFTGSRRKREAYNEECRVYHTMPNRYQRERNHPARPAGTAYSCPRRNCPN